MPAPNFIASSFYQQQNQDNDNTNHDDDNDNHDDDNDNHDDDNSNHDNNNNDPQAEQALAEQAQAINYCEHFLLGIS
eukprot:CAMPEP_0201539508 /NCGR_PEP_ID=MMETSP0161_2-20130828/70444_1 /ASSEMBLY_ACC=CAM_ASM_000251 /TAXON_ID=180227 /ORGANISM="Neoparamoeba aestuarina, Strain SoJaBio B1-5/56/2" /LENGTH=76 /DNA_ID=CAMNT_0047946907 /DNA_START=517 /DNA_END=747 /DNA_ORIENTATION=+